MRKYPVTIFRKESEFKVTTSMRVLEQETSNVADDLRLIEYDYNVFITAATRLLSIMGSQRRKLDPRFYWLLADYMTTFLQHLDGLGFYLTDAVGTFSRDLEISRTTIKKALSVHKLFPSIASIDSRVRWSDYKEKRVRPDNLQAGDKQ